MNEVFFASFLNKIDMYRVIDNETSQIIAEMLEIDAFRVAMNVRKEVYEKELSGYPKSDIIKL